MQPSVFANQFWCRLLSRDLDIRFSDEAVDFKFAKPGCHLSPRSQVDQAKKKDNDGNFQRMSMSTSRQ